MRQHVFAFLVALAVWLGIAAVVGTVCHQSKAQSTLVVGTSELGLICGRYAVVIRDRATCTTTGPCSGDCYGRMYYFERCEPAAQGGDCVERWRTVPIYHAHKPCEENAIGLCWCDGLWQRGEPTGSTTIVTWCNNP